MQKNFIKKLVILQYIITNFYMLNIKYSKNIKIIKSIK